MGPEGVLTGSMRAAQESRERAERLSRRQAIELRERNLDRRRAVTEAQIQALRAELDAAEAEAALFAAQDRAREHALAEERAALAMRRGASKLKGRRKS